MTTVIAGIGMTALTRRSGRSVLDQAGEAVTLALADAGLDRSDVDGLLSYSLGDSISTNTMARALGLSSYRWHADMSGGGSFSASSIVEASMIVDAGLADVVVVYRALNGRSGVRMGTVMPSASEEGDIAFTKPYGSIGPVIRFAPAAQRFLHDRDLDDTHLGRIAVQLRTHATTNPRAVMREPITLEDYLASPHVSTPLRRLDCCLETDGACAVVVTRSDRADDRAVRIVGGVRGGGAGIGTFDRAEDPTTIFSHFVAPQLWETTGLTSGDVDVALVYDAYTFALSAQLEDFGLCPRGGGADAVEAGTVNPHGGLLSEGYVHGLNNVLEGVRQLRDEGTNQVAGAEVALCTGFGGDWGSAVVLARS